MCCVVLGWFAGFSVRRTAKKGCSRRSVCCSALSRIAVHLSPPGLLLLHWAHRVSPPKRSSGMVRSLAAVQQVMLQSARCLVSCSQFAAAASSRWAPPQHPDCLHPFASSIQPPPQRAGLPTVCSSSRGFLSSIMQPESKVYKERRLIGWVCLSTAAELAAGPCVLKLRIGDEGHFFSAERVHGFSPVLVHCPADPLPVACHISCRSPQVLPRAAIRGGVECAALQPVCALVCGVHGADAAT